MKFMISKHSYEKVTWIDLESPTQEEVNSIIEEYKIHPLVADELRNPSRRSKVDHYEGVAYLILHFPTISKGIHTPRGSVEVDFVIGKNFLITAHYEPMAVFHEFEKSFEVTSLLEKQKSGFHAGIVFYHLLRKLYDSLVFNLETIAERIRSAETQVFQGRERKMVGVLSNLNKEMIDFNRSIQDHGEILFSLEGESEELFGVKYGRYIQSLIGEYEKVKNLFHENKEVLSELRETNDSLLSTKMNETMIHLTMMAFVTFPLSLIASVFAIDSQYNPIIGVENDFWIILGIMFSTSLVIFGYFKFRRWL